MGFMEMLNAHLEESKNKASSGGSSSGSSGGSSGGSTPKYVGTGHETFYNNAFNKNNKYTFDAPIAKKLTTSYTKKKKKEDKKKWYESELFDDGYDFGDVSKAILGVSDDTASLKELTVGSLKRGYYNSLYGEETFKAMNGQQNYKDEYKKILEGDEYQFTPGNDAAGAVSGAMELLGQQFRQFTNPRTLAFTGTAAGAAFAAGQAGPQVLVPEEIISVPAAALAGFKTGSSMANLEIEAGHAYNEMLEAGINEETARKVAMGVGAVNAGLDLLQVDELLDAYKVVKKSGATKNFTQKLVSELVDRGVDVAKETAQEVAHEGVTIAGTQVASKLDKGEYAYNADEVKDRLKDTAKSSALSFGLMNAPATVKNTASFVSEQHKANSLTKNEQAVVDKIVADRVEEAEKDGTKLSNSEKRKITESVVSDMEKGYISTDTIEEVLGGETYSAYKKLVDSEDAILKEYDELGEKQNATPKDYARYTELTEKVKDINKNSQRNAYRAKLSEDVMGLVNGSRLAESYNERARTGQKFEADVTKYDAKQQAVVQKAIDSGILNNSNRTHEFVDFVSKISADTGVLFDFSNTEKIREAGFAVEGQTVDGFITKDGITVNIDSPKSRQFVVGHEITHALEGTELYDALRKTVFDYAKMKNQYGVRMESIQKRYKEGTDYEAELTADLVGEYIFSDTDFVKHLSTQNRNVFQKVYDEIKYLCKVATAGSKEARELEKVKRAFEKAYREGGKTQGETKYSVSDSAGKELTAEQQEYFKDSKARDDNGNLIKVYHSSPTAGFTVFDGSEGEGNYKYGDYGDGITFFTDNKAMADSYSPSSEKVDTVKLNNLVEAQEWLTSIGQEFLEVRDENGNYDLYDHIEEEVLREFDSEEELLRELKRAVQEELGDINAGGQYEGYVNLKNPMVVDAEGRPWDSVTEEFSQEVYDKFQSLSEEEKEEIKDLAEWGDYSTFVDEMRDAAKSTDESDPYYSLLSSAFNKLKDETGYVNLYNLYDIAQANFSDEAIRESAVQTLSTNDYVERALQDGSYDGVIIKNVIDYGGHAHATRQSPPGNDYIVFNSNQFKAADNLKPTEDADIRYSLSEVTDEQNQKGLDRKSEVTFSLSNDTAYMDKAIAMNQSSMRIDSNVLAETKAVRERIAERMNAIKDRGLVGLPEDIEGNTYIANSSYDGTEENTTICPRSLASEAFVDAVSEYLGRPLSVNEQIYISQDLQGRSLTPECTYCYVATDRKAYRAFLGEYVSQRDAVLQKVQENPNADVSRSGDLYKQFLNGRKDTNPMYSRFKMWVDAYKNGKPMIDASHLANINKLMGDINSEFGAELKPQIVDAMKYAQSASWAKKRVNYVAYNGHILKWKQDRINKLNSHYGLRMYSFSDFHPAFVLENMQMITDASVRGLKMLGYTKDTDFVDIFAPSGMNINVSTFGFEAGGNVFENNLIGAEWEKAKALRSQYPNVGITFVATNDTLVNWALDQDWIDVVIPYHLVRTGAEVAKAFNYTNYTSESSDTKTKDWKKGDKKYIAPTEHNNDKATYLDALAKNHLKPRFERFIDNPSYMKLVNECRQPASVSKPVQPVFNEDAAMVALSKLEANGYYQPIGGSVDRMYEIAGEVADAMTNELAPAMSLSNVGEQHTSDSLSALRLDAPVSELVTENTPTLSETESVRELFPDDGTDAHAELENLELEEAEIRGVMEAYAGVGDIDAVNVLIPEHEAIRARIRELQQRETDRADSLVESEVPPEMDAPISTKSENYNPYSGVTLDDISRSYRTYSDRNPGARQYIEEAALGFLYDVNNSTHGERWYNDELYYATGGEQGFGGTSRSTTADIADLKDSYGYTWEQLRKAADDVVKGEVRSVAAKRVEYLIHNRLMEGYTDVDGRRYEPNQNYITFLNESFVNEHRAGSFDNLLENADQYAPAEDIAPVKKTPLKPPSKLKDSFTGDAPIFEGRDGQTTMFEPEKKTAPTGGKTANVLTEASRPDKTTGFGMGVVSQTVDKGMAVENLSYKTGNEELQPKYQAALPSTTEAKAQYFMENGANGVKPFKETVQEIQESGKQNDFERYMYHAHNVDRMSLEQRFGIPNKAVYGDSITADVSRAEVAKYEKKNPEFKEWAKEIYAITKWQRSLMVENGLISQETADLWEKRYPHYVPITRKDAKGANVYVPLDTNKTGVYAPIKKAIGGNSDIEPMLNAIAQRIEQTYRAIARNSFGIELKNTLGTTINSQPNVVDVDDVIDTLEDQDSKLLKPGTLNSSPTFTVFENGERVEFEITEELFDSLKPAGKILGHRFESSDKAAVRGIGKALEARRNLLTNWNPVFAWYRNPVKDIQDVAVNSQHPIRTYLSMPKAIVELARNGEWAQEYHANGGKSNTYYDSRKNEFVKESGIKNVFGKIEAPGEFIEEVPRLAEYIASRKNGRSVERSMLDAARVTTNFTAGGDFTKFLNSHGFTFLNASVQGASQHIRNFRQSYHTEGAMGVVKTLAKYVIAGVPTILLNSLKWDDDDDYEELNDYVKQNYYVLWKTDEGKFFRVPKGRTAAVIGELMQQMENLATGDDEVDFSTFFELFMNNIAPSNPLENNIIAPIGQVMSNTAWYGGDLVPSRLQKLPVEEQFDESTDILSRKIGEVTGTSPYKWNYLIDQYSGGLGDVFLPMMTPEAESGDNSFMGNVFAPWKKEMTTDSVLNNKNPGNFYELKDELDVVSNGKNATEEDKMRSMYLDSVSWEMGDLYAQKREIQSSDLPDDRKYEQVREIQEQINAIANNALNKYNHVKVNGMYSEAGDRRYNKDADSGKWYEIKPKNADGSDNWYYQKEQEVTKGLGISYEEYWNNREEYNFAYDKPGKYAIAKAVGGYDTYMEHYDVLENWQSDSYLAADKDSKGNSISGSRKKKVLNYINGLDIDYGERLILYRTVYSSKSDKRKYNQDIIDYLNSRDDISYQDMENILTELDMEVDSKGNISW